MSVMKEYSLGSVLRALGWGALLGGAAGFSLGLLLAPEEGRRLRRRLSYRLENLGHQVSDFADQMLKSETDSDARRTGDALVADAQVRAQRIRSDIEALLGEVRQQGGAPPSSMN
ncbi:MAG: YtxH domain-containing protein [Rhodothermales bacterium]|nr:YtxH domain-containing protein [Rhodothermales bacterium]